MALRKQPDRQVKKKRRVEIPENLDVSKKKRKLDESGNFDIIGNLFCNYGLTGKNLVHDIFSYMDVSSIQGGHLVCKTWNLFLINDRKLLMKILRRRQMHCDGASEDAAGLSTTTRDVSSDRGVTIKMSRHWMRPLNTRIYAHYIPSRAHCPIQYSLCLQRDASMHISHLFASLLRRHIWTFSSPFDTAWVVFGLETSAWFCAANIF